MEERETWEEKRGSRNMRQRDLLDFRTPQRPVRGTNNWGGASPLLARNIPKESLDLSYLRLNNIRGRDEIFPTHDDDIINLPSSPATNPEHAPKPKGRGGLLAMLGLLGKQKVASGSNEKKGAGGYPNGIQKTDGLKVGVDSDSFHV